MLPGVSTHKCRDLQLLFLHQLLATHKRAYPLYSATETLITDLHTYEFILKSKLNGTKNTLCITTISASYTRPVQMLSSVIQIPSVLIYRDTSANKNNMLLRASIANKRNIIDYPGIRLQNTLKHSAISHQNVVVTFPHSTITDNYYYHP